MDQFAGRLGRWDNQGHVQDLAADSAPWRTQRQRRARSRGPDRQKRDSEQTGRLAPTQLVRCPRPSVRGGAGRCQPRTWPFSVRKFLGPTVRVVRLGKFRKPHCRYGRATLDEGRATRCMPSMTRPSGPRMIGKDGSTSCTRCKCSTTLRTVGGVQFVKPVDRVDLANVGHRHLFDGKIAHKWDQAIDIPGVL